MAEKGPNIYQKVWSACEKVPLETVASEVYCAIDRGEALPKDDPRRAGHDAFMKAALASFEKPEDEDLKHAVLRAWKNWQPRIVPDPFSEQPEERASPRCWPLLILLVLSVLSSLLLYYWHRQDRRRLTRFDAACQELQVKKYGEGYSEGMAKQLEECKNPTLKL